MPDSLSPVTMTEDYYAKIAGQDVTPPDPATREQKWLDAIAGRVDGLAEDVEDLGDIVPAPAADDSGKVLTAGADGTASWQTASGGGGFPPVTATLAGASATFDIDADTVYEEGYMTALIGGMVFSRAAAPIGPDDEQLIIWTAAIISDPAISTNTAAVMFFKVIQSGTSGTLSVVRATMSYTPVS